MLTLPRLAMHFAAVPALCAVLASPAVAHGDESHPDPRKAYNAAQVEDTAFGRQGDPRKVQRVIRLEMTDAYRFTPADIQVQRGQTVKFVVHNAGHQLHEMVLGTEADLAAHAELMRKFPDMEHADANMAHVRAGARGEIVWQFTQPGRFAFACLIPGHYEAGMRGQVAVR
jgi:uncharacterized cupredoxin-like copper-binding protein